MIKAPEASGALITPHTQISSSRKVVPSYSTTVVTFYSGIDNLEDVIPPNHLLRRINAVLDLSWLRAELAPLYSHTGCPSIDLELMIRMLLVGYCYSIRLERRLCQKVELNLAYRWLCRLGLEDQVPNHSTFSVNKHGRFHDGDIFRKVFDRIVRQCMDVGHVPDHGLVGQTLPWCAVSGRVHNWIQSSGNL